MPLANRIIIEACNCEDDCWIEFVAIDIKKPLSLKEIYDLFYKLVGYRCDISIRDGTAHVNCYKGK